MNPNQENLSQQFYDDLAYDYDTMTNFRKRLQKEHPIMKSLIEKYYLKRVLDAGCGSGFHSILLARSGVEVIGVDISEAMLKKARENARHFNLKIKFVQANFDELSEWISSPVDGIVCLGNTLAHILEKDQLRMVLQNFKKILKPGGVLIIQLLNYEKILSKKERLIGITGNQTKTFVRFYDLNDPLLQFNILVIEKRETHFKHQWLNTWHYPWRPQELEEAHRKVGFHHVENYGDLTGLPFDAENSPNLVVIAC